MAFVLMCASSQNGLKMIEFSSSLKLNKIHVVDNPFNEDPKKFFQGGTAGKFRENENNRDIYCYANWGWSVSKENISAHPMVPKSYMPEQILGKK